MNEAVNTPALGELARDTVADHAAARPADMDAARVIATEAVLQFGDIADVLAAETALPDDHPAVVAALATIRIGHRLLDADEAAAALVLAETPLPWRADPADNDPDAETIEIWDAKGQYVAEVDLQEYTRESDGSTIGHQVAALIVETMNAWQADATDAAADVAELRSAFEALGAALPWRPAAYDGGILSATGRAAAIVAAIDDDVGSTDPREAALARLITNAVNTAAGFPPAASSQ